MKHHLVITGSISCPRLCIHEYDFPKDVNETWVREKVQKLAEALAGTHYYWIGWYVDGELRQEWSFRQSVVVK